MVLAHDTTQGPRTQDINISQDVTFDTMLLSPETLKGLHAGGFHKPSPVQLHGIPLGKCGFDILLEAKSGTGKTAVFSVIALEKLNLNKGLQVVILAPTREIAAQISDVIKVIGSGYPGLGVEVVMGGLPFQEDIAKFKSTKQVHIVVGSPGRLRHLIQDGYIDTSAVRLLILDEADKLVEKSFQTDINYIFSTLPKQKQVILSSATYPEQTKAFISQYVQNSQHVCPDSTSVLLGIEQKYILVSYSSNIVIQTKQKYKELLKTLSQKQFKQCLIFCNYQARVAKLHNMLTRDKWPSEQLSGQQDQTDRLGALKTLQEYKCRILIATDLAARGIDSSNVDLVINFEPPYEWQTYLHRIGRAGRYGSYGMAVTMLSEGAEKSKFLKLLKPMKNSLNIFNLWDDTNLFNDDFKGTSADIKEDNDNIANIRIDSSTTEQSPDLWKVMTATADQIKEIKSFKELTDSFNQSLSTNIESFSALVQSFENSTISGESEDISYANIKINERSAKECLNNLQCEIKARYSKLHSTDILITKEMPERPFNGYVDKQINALQSKIDQLHPNIGTNQCIENECNGGNKPTASSTNNAKFYIKMEDYNDDHVEAHDEDLDVSALNKEMTLLGLPCAFSSKRDSLNKKRVNIKISQQSETEEENNNYFITSNKNNLKQTSTDYMDPSEESKTNKHLINKGKSVQFVEDIHGMHKRNHVEKYTLSKIKTTRASSKKKCEDGHRGKVYTRKPAHIDDESESSSSTDKDTPSHVKVHLNYINWHKQLKIRTKQLEMAYYIEEMSKM